MRNFFFFITLTWMGFHRQQHRACVNPQLYWPVQMPGMFLLALQPVASLSPNSKHPLTSWNCHCRIKVVLEILWYVSACVKVISTGGGCKADLKQWTIATFSLSERQREVGIFVCLCWSTGGHTALLLLLEADWTCFSMMVCVWLCDCESCQLLTVSSVYIYIF